jgi:sigma-E factor negative regulatory protein RseA
MDKMELRELISTLADGQLQGEALERGLQAMAGDSAAHEVWQTYHLIGDVLRSGQMAAGTAPAVFLRRLQSRLAQEPGTAIDSIASRARPMRATGQSIPHAAAANDSNFRWKMVAGFASVVAMATLGWVLVGGIGVKPQEAQLAVVPPALRSTPEATGTLQATFDANGGSAMIRDPRLDELLAAHRQLGGASALPMPAGFLRNATFEGPAR